eukprot:CAMPEP_0176038440 /NCGR_PEP_ID=MMETSP0120_2-20121206/19049_1 /TAXON_ID=160619 /ORGANISM="Kryptoperidinium foliaceum, Strain CCMP 1326" /LENGTH=292 /DNA_ID=CAMNT_0017371831 /DNA_START=96 /DNA_END=974 /DNA_ORIENTATION=-
MAEPCEHVLIGNLPADLDDAGLKTNFEAYGNIKWCKLFNSNNGGKHAIIEFSTVEEATWLVENLDGNVPLGLETEVTVKYKTKNAGKGGGGGGYSPMGGGSGTMRASPYGGGMKGGGKMGGGMKGGKMGMMMGMMSGQPATMADLWKFLTRMQVLPGGTWANDERTVCVRGLPSDTTEADLLKIFSTFGAILPGGIRLVLNEDGTAKGNGMINYANLESAQSAIETLDNCMLPDGRFLRLTQWHDWNKGKEGKEGKGSKNGKGNKNGKGGAGGGGGGLIKPSGTAAEAEAEG